MGRRRSRRSKAVGEAQAPVLPLDPPKPRDLGGRPSKYTPEVTQRVVDAILKGAGREDAASMAGIHPATFRRWMAAAEKDDESEFCAFRTAVEGAERDLVIACSEGMVDLTRKDVPPAVRFAALKLILQSRRPAVWRPAKEIALSAPGGGPVQVEHGGAVGVTTRAAPTFTDEQLASMSPEQLRAALLGIEGPA